MSDEQLEKWLKEVEGNLCMMLTAIKVTGGELGFYTLGRLITHLEPLAVMIERMLSILYGAGGLKRGEGEPGCFLVKLRQVIESLCPSFRIISGIKGFHNTGGPEEVSGGEDQQRSDPSQQEENCAREESGCLVDSEPDMVFVDNLSDPSGEDANLMPDVD